VNELKVQIKKLIDLQNCDLRITDVQGKKEQGPIKILRLEEGLIAFENKLKDELERLDAYKQESRKIDREIEDIDSRIGKSNNKLSNIKSNKEYTAALKELDELKRLKSLSEDKGLDIMEELEMLESGCVESKAKMEELKKDVEKDRDKIMEEMKALEQEFKRLEMERVSLGQAIDENLLKRYDFIRERKGGIVVSPVIKGVCQTCHLDIPPQRFNELIRGDKLMNCPNCIRIIYWGEDESFKNDAATGEDAKE
jgi:predicted  nucleic acid-binding Zn-ribbon protein